MAIVVKTDDDLAIIEIIDDDVDPFGDRATTTTVHDTGGPRWVGPVAAAALIALMAYGVATSGSSTGAPKVAPVVTTVPAPTTTSQPVAPTTTTAPQLVPYYAADPPTKFTLQSTQFENTPGIFRPDGLGTYELWATSDATASSGRWFSIETSSGGESIYAPNAYRVQSGAQSIAISHSSSGQTIAQFAHGGSVGVTLTAFGWSDADLIALASSVTADQRAVHFNDRSLLTGLQLLSSVQPWLAVQGNPVEFVNYTDGQGFTGGINLTVAPRPAADQGGDTFDRQVALRFFFLDNAIPFDADGHVAVAGNVTGVKDFTLATWIAGDHIVTISGSLPVQQLIDIARTVHQVPAEVWAGMQLEAGRNSSEGTSSPVASLPTPVSFGTDAASKAWQIDVLMFTFPTEQLVSWQWLGSGYGWGATDAPTINTVVEGQRTYVLADLPRSVAATAQLQINRDGVDPVTVPFNDAQPASDRTFAAYAFSEATTYTAQIIGADGAVLATWPSG